MTNSHFVEPPEQGKEIDQVTASRMLAEADQVSASAQRRVNPGIQFLFQTWASVVLFAYTATFLLVFTTPAPASGANPSTLGSVYAGMLLIPLLAQIQLVQGARNRLPVSQMKPLQARTVLLGLLGIAVFIAIAAMSVMGVEVAWWLCILVAAGVAVPPAILTLSSRKKANARTGERSVSGVQPPLTRTARYGTLGLGIYFGIAGGSTTFSWFPFASVLLIIVLLILIILGNTRWGLASVGSEWQRNHWVAFGASFLLYFALTLIVARTSWNTPVVGVIGGVLIAAPLVIAALASRRER